MSTDKRPIRVMFAVPSFRGTVAIHTMASLVRTVALFGELGIQSELVNVDSAEIVVVRNAMASLVLSRKDITHLLFVDDDMSFEADAVVDLLRASKPLVGAIYPRREISYERFHEAAKAGLGLVEATTAALGFVVRHIPAANVSVVEGLCPVAGLGMGLTLIRREVLEEMVAKGVVEQRKPHNGGERDQLGNTAVWTFFENIYSPDTGTMLSEDLSFCERWRVQCGGEIWGKVDRKVGHVGTAMYAGAYVDLLKMGRV